MPIRLLALWVLVGCGDKDTGEAPEEADADTDSDTDADTLSLIHI